MLNPISKKAPQTPTKELVINWHMTEVCNYSCSYCFAKWGRPSEIHRSTEDMMKLLDKLADYFINSSPSLKQQLGYETVRLNFAGGEPMLLGNKFITALKSAKEKGFKTSIITNGHYLVNNQMTLPENTLDMIGISFDSLDLETRKNIGRKDRKGNSFGEEELKRVFLELKKSQNGIKT